MPGQQARIITRSGTALFTLIESSTFSSREEIQLSPAGLRRLGRRVADTAAIDLRAVRSDLTAHVAMAAGELIETLSDTGQHRNVIAIAPHGGTIEKYTDRQAEIVYEHLGPNRASRWDCRGWQCGGGAFTKWHITSTNISERSFPLLRQVARRKFRHAVAFHGCRSEEVLIGGRGDHTLKQELHEAISRTLTGTAVPVRLLAPDDRYAGSAPENLVNRLAHDGNGIQLEQGPTARRDHWATIAQAVAEVYDRRINLSQP
ncbi:poly-gamma-glutamate hydrolase family protein [Nocardia gipuzkoensis]